MSNELHPEVFEQFGNRLRVRCCGLLYHQQSLLLVRHHMGREQYLWTPPGGGMQFGESASQCLAREFFEETSLEIHVGRLVFVHELLKPPLHGIELFFEVRSVQPQARVQLGHDPEVRTKLIDRLAFFSDQKIQQIPGTQRHPLLRQYAPSQLQQLSGYFCSIINT